MFKIQTQEENGQWHDVRGIGGNILQFASRASAQERLAALFPDLVGGEPYGGQDRTRIIAIQDDRNNTREEHPGDLRRERPQR